MCQFQASFMTNPIESAIALSSKTNKAIALSKAGFPLVVFIHGGGWISGDTRHSAPFVNFSKVLASLSAKGYTVA